MKPFCVACQVNIHPKAEKAIIQGFSVLYPPRSGLLHLFAVDSLFEQERQERL